MAKPETNSTKCLFSMLSGQGLKYRRINRPIIKAVN